MIGPLSKVEITNLLIQINRRKQIDEEHKEHEPEKHDEERLKPPSNKLTAKDFLKKDQEKPSLSITAASKKKKKKNDKRTDKDEKEKKK